VLKPNGELRIAEIVSRFSDLDAFFSVLREIGFKLVNQDDANKMFVLFDFVKTLPKKVKNSQIPTAVRLLKPCAYKKR